MEKGRNILLQIEKGHRKKKEGYVTTHSCFNSLIETFPPIIVYSWEEDEKRGKVLLHNKKRSEEEEEEEERFYYSRELLNSLINKFTHLTFYP